MQLSPPRFPSVCENSIKSCSKRHKYFGKITTLLLARTLEDTARVKTQFTKTKQIFNVVMSLSFTLLNFGFFTKMHLIWHMTSTRRNLLNSPPVCPSSICRWRPRFCVVTISHCSSGQKERPVCNITLLWHSFILCCNFLAISALPFFVLSLSYLKWGQVVGVLHRGTTRGIHPLVKRLFIKNKS